MQVFEDIPGLFVEPDYLTPAECRTLIEHALALHTRLEEAAAGSAGLDKAHIPQPEFVRSSYHNLPSEEFYTRVVLTEAQQRKLSCEYFPRYGEDGHALCYFRDGENLPDFVRDHLLEPVHQTVLAARLAEPEQELTWKLTMNFYRSIGGTVAGFPFHVDIPANGVVTMIINIQREALFQITNGLTTTDIQLPVGCLLILSGESRYEWKHRVLPMQASGESLPGGIERISLVLGFQ